MSPKPGVPSAKGSQNTNEASPSKKIKTEIQEHDEDKLETEVKNELVSPSRMRKRMPIQLRLGDFISTTINSQTQQGSVIENNGSPSSATVTDGILIKCERETDAAVLERRMKQLEYGKNTPEYHSYTVAVPRAERESHHPKTPNQKRKYSRRAWDGLVKQWRLQLHFWSDPGQLELEKIRRKELHDDSFCSEATSASNSTTESGSQLNINSVIKKEDSSWFEEVEDFYDDDDDDDEDNIQVTIK